MRLAVLVVAGVLAAAPAAAVDLEEVCKKPTKACAMYAAGVADAASYFAMNYGATALFCIAPPTSDFDKAQAVVRHMKASPDNDKDGSPQIVMDALRVAWPCR